MIDLESSSQVGELPQEPSIPLLALSEFEGGNQLPTWDINSECIREKRLSLLSLMLSSWKENAVDDLILILGSRKLRCNRFMLLCHSKYALRELGKGRCELVLPEDRVSWKGLKVTCEWMKKSNELLELRNIAYLLSTAIFLEIEHLVRQIWYCMELPEEFHDDRAYIVSQDVLDLRSIKCLQGLDTIMLHRIRCFFLTLVSSIQFIELCAEHVCDLLNSDELAVNSEKEVLFAAVRWLTHDWPSRAEHIGAVMQVIRFPLLLRNGIIELRRPTDDQVLNLVIAHPEFQRVRRHGLSDFCNICCNDTEIYKQHCGSLKSKPSRRLFICHDLCTYHRHHDDKYLGDFTYNQFIDYMEVLQKSPKSWKCLKAEEIPFTFE
ncbi:kelch-like protein 3 [Drosophila albomicans]|uniref:Kelch-like protein 3 n=1 Tax=Drosophila albomicans TaxID=7291 RepID=A0A6P8X191_DROAB|nr:kelch-like protein 3 [Drosophila albomicans]